MRKPLILTAAAACVLLAACSSSNESKKEETQAPSAAASPTPTPTPEAAPSPTPTPTPEPKKSASALPEKAPDNFKVNMETSKGVIVMACHKDWSPHGVDHFYDLVKLHFYDGSRFFRVVRSPRPFMVQFGINGDPATDKVWANASIKDDPPNGHTNARGTVAYGNTGMPNSRSTQLFINYANNSFLDTQPAPFTPICEVTSGMDVADQVYDGYGERPNQDLMHTQGNAYLEREFP
ncbi:MAG TPA: peptidylprolyl isomerase, partial [Verrucomicrobiae bacterium]|nr:peptidylprolyl isomerase [Verrucomicrobiae bacterium]